MDKGSVVVNSKESVQSKPLQEKALHSELDIKPEIKETEQASSSSFKPKNPDAIAFAKQNNRALREGYGLTPATTQEEIDQSVQLQNAVVAANNPKENHNQLSLLAKIAPFDKERWDSDEEYRKQYLSIAEPARVYQEDQNAKHKLERLSPYFQKVKQKDDSVVIEVRSIPGYPTSATSLDLGKLGNGLTHQTVLTGNDGVAKFEFFGVEGTINDSKILVSSPVTSGVLKFVVHTEFNN